MSELPVTRRLVTAIDKDGRSYHAEDGPSPASLASPARPGFRNDNIWRTTGRIDAPDSILEQKGLLPPKDGTLIRVIDFPPLQGSLEDQRAATKAIFAKMYPDAVHDADNTRAAGMHTTDTVDYAICMEGEIWSVMEKDEKLMTRGDILIQRGTHHAWENRSDKPARICFVLVDAKR